MSSAKATHIFFSAKNIRILYIESAKTVNEMTLNELVKLTTFEQLCPGLYQLPSALFTNWSIYLAKAWGIKNGIHDFSCQQCRMYLTCRKKYLMQYKNCASIVSAYSV